MTAGRKKSIGRIIRERHRQEAREELINEMIETLAVLDTHGPYCECDPCKVLKPAYRQWQLDVTSTGNQLPPRRVPATAGR